MRLSSIFCLVAAMLPWSVSQAADQLMMTVRGIEFPGGEAQKLMAATRDDDCYEAMAKAVDDGKAVDLESFAMQVRSGQRALAGSGHEVIYPGERDLGGLSPIPPAKPPKPPIPGDILTGRFDVFETRKAGISYDFSPVYSDHVFHLRTVMEFTVQEPDRIILKHQLFEGMPQVISQPTFRVTRFNTELTLGDGQWIMAGLVDSWRKDAPPGTKVAMWVTVESIDESKR